MEIIDSTDKCNWLLETLMEDISVPAGDIPPPDRTSIGDFNWPLQPLNGSSTESVEVDCSYGVLDGFKEVGSQEQLKVKSYSGSGSKAARREKLRREKLNKRFLELAFILEPGRKPKPDKADILSNALQTVTQLRSESQKLQDSNEELQQKVKELKAERNELRDEMQKVKAEKKKLERQVKAMSSAPRPGFLAHPSQLSAAYAALGQSTGSNMMPFMGYPGVAMCQFMPPANINSSSEDGSDSS